MAPYLDSTADRSTTAAVPPPPPVDLSLPRILCLHGGGTNADIFTLQCRALSSSLRDAFRLVFADGPHFCGPGPDVSLVYAADGPFRRWLRWKPDEHAAIDDESAADEIDYSLRRAMEDDQGTGEWVGLLGFSQGGKVAASLLYDVQVRERLGLEVRTGWRFAVVMAARHPLVCLSECTRHPALVEAGAVSEGFSYDGVLEEKLSMPTIHVHGMQDPGLPLHRRMLNQYCEPSSVTLLEWNGGHRLPFKTVDVSRICEVIRKVALEAGVRI